MMSARLPALLMAIMFLAACSSGSTIAVDPTVPDAPVPTSWADVESAELPAFDESLPVIDRNVRHDAPDSLLRSLADDGIIEEVQGFRIQVFSSIDRIQAIQMEESVEAWIRRRTPERRVELGIASPQVVYNIFSSPYFRVRVGDFRFREDAAALRDALAREYQGVLIVPDLVTVVRR